MKAALRHYYAEHAAERPIPDDGDLASATGVFGSAFLGGLVWAVVLLLIFAS